MSKIKPVSKFNIFNIFNISKNEKLKNNIVLKILFILFITALCIIILYALYYGIRKVLYMYRLKTDFYKLKEMGIEIQNFNILYVEEVKRKWPSNPVKVRNKKNIEFKNKNAIGMISDKYIILDFDTKDHLPQADFVLDMIPKDTAYEKTPNGYHYYFENDTGKVINTRVQVTIGGIKYALDVLGNDSLVFMSPTRIGGKEYYWINSIFTHKPAKVSENMWIFDLLEGTAPFYKKFENMDIKININNALIIVDNIFIESQIRFIYGIIKQHSKKMKYLNGYVYIYDNNYYFLTKSSFNKIKNKTYLLNKMRDLVVQINPSYIIDLSTIYSNNYKPNSIFQITSAIIDNNYKNYKNIRKIDNYIEIDKNTTHKTKYLIKDTITIAKDINSESSNNYTNADNNKILLGCESIYISLLLSTEYNIPNVTLGIVEEKDTNDVRSTSISTSDKIFNSLVSLF